MKKAMTRILFFIMVVITSVSLAFAFLPISLLPHGGVYNYASGWMSCRDEMSCLYVVGQRVDALNGNLSQSQEFRKAVNDYVSRDLQDKWSVKINSVFKNGDIQSADTWRSLYAQMYVWSLTDVSFPHEFARFFHPVIKTIWFKHL